ncbi:FCD domain-containing protein [Streptomyces sp. NPDC059445]|uniref:FCD domain-containing protein n=1 Tax=Streptomyces sp. NPDC059445 TaxID=3346832 RepID=UPI0036C2C59F
MPHPRTEGPRPAVRADEARPAANPGDGRPAPADETRPAARPGDTGPGAGPTRTDGTRPGPDTQGTRVGHTEEAHPAAREPNTRPAHREEARPAHREEARPAHREEARPAHREEARPVHGEEARPARREEARPAVRAEAARPVVQRASVRGQVLDALRTALVAGELAPGEVYSAPALGERFGVSATPVREAMQQLALEGAVEVVPNRGFRVIERGTRELAELAEIRGLIEVPVMLRLARTVPAARWAELRPLAEATVRAASSGCRATYAESDRSFHRAVLALAGNAQLVRIADDLHRRAQWPLVGGPVSRGRADLVADAAEHTALLDALMAGDLPVVQSLVREHFTGAP